MNIVKIRKVGNSNVITLPRALQALGFAEGTQVVVETTPEGEVRLIRADALRDVIRTSGRKVAREHTEALRMLAEAEGVSPTDDSVPAVAD